MVLKLGINEWPMPGRLVSAQRTRTNIITHKKRWRALVPYAVWKDLFFAAFILLAVAACALYLVRSSYRPPGPDDHPDGAETRLLLFVAVRLLSYLPPSMETPALLIGP